MEQKARADGAAMKLQWDKLLAQREDFERERREFRLQQEKFFEEEKAKKAEKVRKFVVESRPAETLPSVAVKKDSVAPPSTAIVA